MDEVSLANGNDPSDCDTTAIDDLSKEELDALHKLQRETISTLEADISLLERKIRQFGPAASPRKDFELNTRPNDINILEELENLQKEVTTYSARVKETVRMTGVTIENVTREVLQLDDKHCRKQFALELRFMNRTVHLKYNLEDNMTFVGEQGGKVTWFEIKMEEDISQAVGSDIAKAADNLEIHSVFSILKSFIQWKTERDELMKHFTEKYPENVSQQTGKGGHLCLRIINTKPDHPEFILEWSRQIANSRVEAVITVEVNAVPELLEMDSKQVLQTIPKMFATMREKLGLEKAIDSLVQMVISDGQNILQEQPVPVETPPRDAELMETPTVETLPENALLTEATIIETSQEDAVPMETPQEDAVPMKTPLVETSQEHAELIETPLVETSQEDTELIETPLVETSQGDTEPIETPLVETSQEDTD
ncbi:hypothetical protein BsWGS_13678 [Bradybaena similaris]